MADKQPAKTTEDKKSTVRRVKNPETFRERAIKASEVGDKPTRKSRIRKVGSRATSPVFGPIGTVFRKIYGLKPIKILMVPVRLIGKVLLPVYVRNSWKELRLVKWPTWQESRRLTSAVIIFAVIFGAIVAVVDFGLDKLFRNVLLK